MTGLSCGMYSDYLSKSDPISYSPNFYLNKVTSPFLISRFEFTMFL